jgi:DUF4097 and DUF4098 domain-containing protein YvlB
VDSQSQIVREEKRFIVSGPADLRLTTFDGSIQIRSWDKPDIVVEIEKRGSSRESVDALEVMAEQKGDTIDVEVKRPRSETFSGIGLHRTATARLLVTVPRTTNIRARSGDGSIVVEGVRGRLDVHTGDGSIRCNDIGGELTMATGDGSITVEGAEGRLDANTGDGGVRAGGRFGTVRIHTGDGAVVYRAQPDSTMTDPWEITTGDGSVTVYLPRDFGAELDAYTGDGGIRNDLDDASLERDDRDARGNRDRERARRSLRGRIGAGGPQLRIRTGDGAIRLRVS